MYFHKEICESFVSQDQELDMVIQATGCSGSGMGMVAQGTGYGGTGSWVWWCRQLVRWWRELGLIAQACDPNDWGVKGQEDQESKVTFH